jgi:UDP-N-acetylmuramate--alanine ligase
MEQASLSGMKIARSEVHFVGIGGIGMSGLAELLKNMGADVTGSDLHESPNTQRLRALGIPVAVGHASDNIKNPDVVVYSSAVPMENPEIQRARALKIPIIPRAEVLAEVMRLKRGIAVGGTHGKTTTTSMIASILINARLDPTVVVGGRLDLIKSNSLLGQGEWLVAEADESDGSFLHLTPEIAVVTNIDDDHMEHFKSGEALENAFLDFASRAPFYGLTVACGDDPRVRRVFENFNKRILFYGFESHNDLQLRGEKTRYEILSKGRLLGRFDLNIPGRHNALNAAAAVAVSLEIGLDFAACAAGLSLFVGVDRRFHWKGEARGVKVYDDYGHHPTEIAAVLQAFREKFPENKIKILFQPHRYTRTKTSWKEFLTCFGGADEVFVTDIYPAGEKPIAQVDSERLAKEIRHSKVRYVGSSKSSLAKIQETLQSGDVLVTLGAGDIWKVGMEFLAEFSGGL